VQGRVFIDRDPKHFRIILNYLRDSACVVPTEGTEIAELLKEIDFYQVCSTPHCVCGGSRNCTAWGSRQGEKGHASGRPCEYTPYHLENSEGEKGGGGGGVALRLSFSGSEHEACCAVRGHEGFCGGVAAIFGSPLEGGHRLSSQGGCCKTFSIGQGLAAVQDL